MRWIILPLIAVFVAVGCNKPGADRGPTESAWHDLKAVPKEMAKSEVARPAGGEFVAAQNPQAPPPKDEKKAQPRKIRYTADLRLIVADLAKAEEELDAAITAADGLLAGSESNLSAGVQRTSTFRIRIPVKGFRDFRKTVAKLGEIEKNTIDSEDMTDKYYDLEAHIKNRMAARDALRDMLKEIGKQKVPEYLLIKEKLEAITDEIDRKEGMLRLWANQTDLTTITVHLRQKQASTPEAAPKDKADPTFGERASSTWTGSWEAFLGACQAFILVAIALVPWVPIPLAGLLVFGLIVRRMSRGVATATKT